MLFLITPNHFSGAVSVKKRPDRESTETYMIKIQAMDHGVPSRSSTTTATIFITDINDNAPVFDNRRLTGYVMENRDAGTSVVTVKATDKDAGENARVKYSLKTNDAFSINEVTGEVRFSVSPNLVADNELLIGKDGKYFPKILFML